MRKPRPPDPGGSESFTPFERSQVEQSVPRRFEWQDERHASRLAVRIGGHVFDHPGEKNCKIFVLESGEGKVGQWVYFERNIHKDFKKAFEQDPPGVLAIGIKTDTDHSNEMVTAY